MRFRLAVSSGMAAWFSGALLPIPFYVELATGAPARASLRTGTLPPVPVSAFVILPAALLIIQRRHVVISVLRRSRAAVSMVGYFSVLGVAGLAAGLYSPRSTLFAAQLFFPIWAFLLLAVVSHDKHLTRSFSGGLQLGLTIAITFIIMALMADWRGFVLAGRIDQYEAPLRGMYQVGNYTPLGLVYAGGLSLALAGMVGSESKSTIGVLGVLTGALVFGSRDALLVAIVVGIAYVLLRPRRRLAACVAIGGAIVGILAMVWISGGELLRPSEIKVSSVERLVAEGWDERRVALLRERGIEALMSGGIGGRMFSGHRGQGKLVRESSHNFYMDLLVDWGWMGVILIAMLLRGTVGGCVVALAEMVTRRSTMPWRESRVLAAALVLGMALISSNVRTPYSQPFSAAIGMAAIGLLAGLEARSRKSFLNSAAQSRDAPIRRRVLTS